MRLSKLKPAPTDIEQTFWSNNEYNFIAGVDEVGRGPIAGPVVAAAVILHPGTECLQGVLDSKKLSKNTLLAAYNNIIKNCYCYAVSCSTSSEIDRTNILKASLNAMKKSIKELKVRPDLVLVDGNTAIPELNIDQKTVIKGDSKSASIAAASIVAKVMRDNLMIKLSKEYPEYKWESNKGYPVKVHINAIKTHGLSPYHRMSFKSCK